MTQLNIQTQRDRIVSEWKASGKPYLANFKAYKSTAQISFVVIHALGNTMAHAVAKPGQVLEFFSYGIGDAIPYGPTPLQKRATESDTNVTSSHNTNGQEDFVIEGASLTCSATRVAYAATLAESLTDADVIGAYRGQVPLHDPAALIAPPQVCSPFNLENALMTALLPWMTFEFEFDRRRKEQIGTLDQVPEGGAKSFLRANGDPRTDNRIRFPEGFIWRGEGKPDSEMVVRSQLRSPVVIPISLVDLEAVVSDLPTQPTHIFLDLALRVHGLACGPLSRN